MQNQPTDKERGRPPRKGERWLRMMVDSGRGLLIFIIGICFLIAQEMGVNMGLDKEYVYGFSGLCLLYGGWRVYRGYKRNLN